MKPDLTSFPDIPGLQGKQIAKVKRNKAKERDAKMRYAAYIRISSEEQIGNFSIDAQKRAIEAWVAAKKGILAKVYVDEGLSGRTTDRPAFQRMRRDARRKQFDALIVHKFDRLARNRTDALAVKSLLRYDLGIKVYSVSEPSEDSDGPMGALIEGIMESVADWYSRNLATEVAKGKKERSHQGLHNNRAPFGMTKNEDKVLIPDSKEHPGLVMAFREYASGQYSDNDIAGLLNDAGYRSKTGRPFSKDTIRDLLQNRTYLGQVKYQKYKRTADGRRSYSAPVHWLDGQHDPVLDEDLFDRCQEVRAERRSHRQPTKKYNHYLLRDIAYCYRCCSNPPEGKTFRNYGKLRCQAQKGGRNRYYRCRANELGYDCDQPGVRVEDIDGQVVTILKNLKPPKDWRKGVTAAVSEMLGERNLDERLAEIREIIQRMDMRWDHGFFADEEEYIEQRLKLQQELEQLTPIPDDDLEQAANLLNEFGTHWKRLEGKPKAQRDLVKLIVQRVYIEGKDVVAMTLCSNYHLVLGNNVKGPTEFSVDPFVYTSGSDGRCARRLVNSI
jgi:DNA invertase Pin-like site-specific DNA recombinase